MDTVNSSKFMNAYPYQYIIVLSLLRNEFKVFRWMREYPSICVIDYLIHYVITQKSL